MLYTSISIYGCWIFVIEIVSGETNIAFLLTGFWVG